LRHHPGMAEDLVVSGVVVGHPPALPQRAGGGTDRQDTAEFKVFVPSGTANPGAG
jgi:hypothetical protein